MRRARVARCYTSRSGSRRGRNGRPGRPPTGRWPSPRRLAGVGTRSAARRGGGAGGTAHRSGWRADSPAPGRGPPTFGHLRQRVVGVDAPACRRPARARVRAAPVGLYARGASGVVDHARHPRRGRPPRSADGGLDDGHAPVVAAAGGQRVHPRHGPGGGSAGDGGSCGVCPARHARLCGGGGARGGPRAPPATGNLALRGGARGGVVGVRPEAGSASRLVAGGWPGCGGGDAPLAGRGALDGGLGVGGHRRDVRAGGRRSNPAALDGVGTVASRRERGVSQPKAHPHRPDGARGLGAVDGPPAGRGARGLRCVPAPARGPQVQPHGGCLAAAASGDAAVPAGGRSGGPPAGDPPRTEGGGLGADRSAADGVGAARLGASRHRRCGGGGGSGAAVGGDAAAGGGGATM